MLHAVIGQHLGAFLQEVSARGDESGLPRFAVLAGLKLALPRAVSAAVVGGFIAADRGLGYYINNARAMADPVGLFAGVAVVTVLVVALDAGLGRVEARSLAWRPLVER